MRIMPKWSLIRQYILICIGISLMIYVLVGLYVVQLDPDGENLSEDTYAIATDSEGKFTHFYRVKPNRASLKNVLFIIADDLRNQINTYKGRYYPNPNSEMDMFTPNLDKLANKSLVLTQAFVQYSICGPSRASFMTGRRPDTTQIWDLFHYWRDVGNNFTTLPQYFKENGYATAGVGKIYHTTSMASHHDGPSWSIPYETVHSTFDKKKTWAAITKAERESKGPLIDEKVTKIARERLVTLAENYKTQQEPFFLAVGFYRPHLPFTCGAEFWDHYPMEKVDLPEYGFLPQEFPKLAFHESEEFMHKQALQDIGFKGKMNETLSNGTMRTLRQAYYACVSHVDSMVGELLDDLQSLGVAENTIVSFIGDHGYHLGEQSMWGKHQLFRVANNAPMMIHIPGKTDDGVRSDSLVEFVDLFPTLTEAAGLGGVPRCPPGNSTHILLCTEGISLVPLVTKPDRIIKETVYTQLRALHGVNGMQYSMRTTRFLYNEIIPFACKDMGDGTYHYDVLYEGDTAIELYDLKRDPLETKNLANTKKYLRIRAEFSVHLHDFVRHTTNFQNVSFIIFGKHCFN